jgi:hypothetical protein
MWRRVGLVRTDVSEKRVASIFRVQRIRYIRTTLAVAGSQPFANAALRSRVLSTLKMKATPSSKTSVLTRTTRRHIQENGTFHSDGSENKSASVGDEQFQH